jgi:serine phosphatase RsbU (regulator of sigma subunit)
VLDNARLYSRSQSMAVALQRSLLTPAVQPPDLQIAVRYKPAIEDSQVGGDWYDAFQTADATTTLVIGDVMGHDTEAAALMGQLRTLVRSIAVDRQEAPSEVLTRVDAAAEALGVYTTATGVLAQILPGDSAGSRRFRWSNAGHPPPVLIQPDGVVRILDAPADLLLGFGGRFPRADHTEDLPAGSTVLMFTDGLVEGRSQPFDIGMRRLAIAAGTLTGLSLDALCDRLLAALMPEQGAEDDVALVAVRILPPTDPA